LPSLAATDRTVPAELEPPTATAAAQLIAALESDADKLQVDHDRTRDDLGAARTRLANIRSHAERVDAHANRLTDLNVVPGPPLPDLAPDDPQIFPRVDASCADLRRTRTELEQERAELDRRHAALRDIVRCDEFSAEIPIPARTLFAALTLDDLTRDNIAADRRQAVADQTATLRAELTQMQQHRELIVGELLSEAEKAVSLFRRAERLSRMPDTMTGWEGESFLRLHLAFPHSQDEKLSRLRAYVEDLLSRAAIPDGIRLVFESVLALATERGLDASILKPETQRRKTRYPVREMSGWSEGERTTVAILLYCTLVKLRAQSRGLAERRAEVSALLLDNPVGKASKPEFLELHRWIAGTLGVQLIYATGINDPQALAIFPNRIRLAKNRIVPQTGELAVGVLADPAEATVTDIRIFDTLTAAISPAR
jgi:hypothetical protein